MYFAQENKKIQQKKLNKEELKKNSLKSVMNFVRDFELCPYLIHQKACFLIWYSIVESESLEDLTNNGRIDNILPND